MKNYFEIQLEKASLNDISVLGLAHVGDGVFELLVRTWLCAAGKATPAELHRATVRYVSAPAQAARTEKLIPLLTEEELTYYKRGRNAHARHGIPKNASHEQYTRATGLEALFGALYLLGRRDRINELFCLTMEDENAI